MQEEGFPTLAMERQRSGEGVAKRRSAQANRGPCGVLSRWGGECGRLGCLLSRARDGVPQGDCLPCTARQRHDLLHWLLGVDVAGGNGRCGGGMEDGSLIACRNRRGNPTRKRLGRIRLMVACNSGMLDVIDLGWLNS